MGNYLSFKDISFTSCRLFISLFGKNFQQLRVWGGVYPNIPPLATPLSHIDRNENIIFFVIFKEEEFFRRAQCDIPTLACSTNPHVLFSALPSELETDYMSEIDIVWSKRSDNVGADARHRVAPASTLFASRRSQSVRERSADQLFRRVGAWQVEGEGSVQWIINGYRIMLTLSL